MKLHTFFEPVNGFDADGELAVIELWKKYWARFGWEPVVLGLSDVKQSDVYEANRLLDQLPQGGQRQYNLYCMLRWFAMRSIGGWIADYDIFPLREISQEYRDGISVYQPGVTCLISGSKDDYADMIEQFKAYKLNNEDHQRGRVMEMHMLRRCTHYCVNLVSSYLENGWEEYDVLHFPNAIMNHHKLTPRAVEIERIMQQLLPE